MASPVLQCAANFSEGQRADVVAAIVEAITSTAGACLADWSSDADHNRMVATVLGEPGPVLDAVVRAASVAVRRIDLRTHSGVHPRIGAVDVVPLTPLRGLTMADCATLSHSLASRLADACQVPVLMYERSARPDHESALPALRRGGFETIASLTTIPSDYGPKQAHPSAGVTVVGARPPLVAWNIMIREDCLSAAHEMAARIRHMRESDARLNGVRALGLRLAALGMSQVSMNVTLPSETPLAPIVDLVRRWSRELNVEPAYSELIGLVPSSCIAGASPETLLWPGFAPERTVEYWLERL